MRRYFRSLFLVLALALLATPPVQAQRALSVATLAPAGSSWMRVFESASRELRTRSNRALSLQFYPGGVQGDESEVIRKIRAGRLDAAAITGIGMGQIYRPSLAFMIPGMFHNRDAMERSRRALATEFEGQFLQQGFVMLAWGEMGSPRMFSMRPIHSPADLQQTHPWVWRDDLILPALYAEAGAHPVSLQVPEVLTALQTNRVDTVVAAPLVAMALQWTARLSHISDQADSFGLGAIVMSRRTYDSLPPEQQTMLREVVNNYNGLLARNTSREDTQALATMQQRGMQIVQVTPAERAQWNALFARTRARLTGPVADAALMQRIQNAGH